MFRFGFTEALFGYLLLLPLVVVFWVAFRLRVRALKAFGDRALMERLTDTLSRRGRTVKAVLLIVSVAMLVTALARPQFGTRVETVRREGQDIVVALDLSNSMLAEDMAPNRLERAKLAVSRLMGRLDGDRIGLVAFAGDAFVQSPLTVDYAAAAMFLNAMGPNIMPLQGTNLGAALTVSLDAFDDEARQHRILVVITDGEDHEGEVDAAVERAVEEQIRVFAVGIGSAEGVPIPDYNAAGQRRGFKRDGDGNVVTTRLDQETLVRIAEQTGGNYYHVTPGGAELNALADEIASMTGRTVSGLPGFRARAAIGGVLGTGEEACLSSVEREVRMSSKVAARQCSRVERPAAASPPFRRSVVPPLRRRWVIRFALTMTVLITLAPASAETQRGRADVREGNRLYGERRYAEAHERYLDALRDAPDSPLIRFNDGNALYQTQEFQRALEAYRDAIESGDATLVSDSWYNLGNVLYRQQKLQEALEAYKEALRHDPSDIDAKHNLERVLQQLQQQQQQQQQQQGQDDQQQDEQEPAGATAAERNESRGS